MSIVMQQTDLETLRLKLWGLCCAARPADLPSPWDSVASDLEAALAACLQPPAAELAAAAQGVAAERLVFAPRAAPPGGCRPAVAAGATLAIPNAFKQMIDHGFGARVRQIAGAPVLVPMALR